MTKTSLVKGTAVLAAGLFSVSFWAFFQDPSGKYDRCGRHGQLCAGLSFYNFLLVFSTAGIPVAVSKWFRNVEADGQCREAAQVFHLSRMLMFMTGITGLVSCFFMQGDRRTVSCTGILFRCELWHRHCFWSRWLLPVVGYFQGMNNMNSATVSQITEQISCCRTDRNGYVPEKRLTSRSS